MSFSASGQQPFASLIQYSQHHDLSDDSDQDVDSANKRGRQSLVHAQASSRRPSSALVPASLVNPDGLESVLQGATDALAREKAWRRKRALTKGSNWEDDDDDDDDECSEDMEAHKAASRNLRFRAAISRLRNILKLLSLSRRRRRNSTIGMKFRATRLLDQPRVEAKTVFLGYLISNSTKGTASMLAAVCAQNGFESVDRDRLDRLVSLTVKGSHGAKACVANYAWTEYVEPLMEEIDRLKQVNANLQTQFHNSRAEYLKEVTALRDEVRVRGDPECHLHKINRSSDIAFFYEPLDSLSEAEKEFVMQVVTEKLKMIVEANPRVMQTVDFGQIDKLQELFAASEAKKMQEALKISHQEITDLRNEVRRLQRELAHCERARRQAAMATSEAGLASVLQSKSDARVQELEAKLEASEAARTELSQLLRANTLAAEVQKKQLAEELRQARLDLGDSNNLVAEHAQRAAAKSEEVHRLQMELQRWESGNSASSSSSLDGTGVRGASKTISTQTERYWATRSRGIQTASAGDDGDCGIDEADLEDKLEVVLVRPEQRSASHQTPGIGGPGRKMRPASGRRLAGTRELQQQQQQQQSSQVQATCTPPLPMLTPRVDSQVDQHAAGPRPSSASLHCSMPPLFGEDPAHSKTGSAATWESGPPLMLPKSHSAGNPRDATGSVSTSSGSSDSQLGLDQSQDIEASSRHALPDRSGSSSPLQDLSLPFDDGDQGQQSPAEPGSPSGNSSPGASPTPPTGGSKSRTRRGMGDERARPLSGTAPVKPSSAIPMRRPSKVVGIGISGVGGTAPLSQSQGANAPHLQPVPPGSPASSSASMPTYPASARGASSRPQPGRASSLGQETLTKPPPMFGEELEIEEDSSNSIAISVVTPCGTAGGAPPAGSTQQQLGPGAAADNMHSPVVHTTPRPRSVSVDSASVISSETAEGDEEEEVYYSSGSPQGHSRRFSNTGPVRRLLQPLGWNCFGGGQDPFAGTLAQPGGELPGRLTAAAAASMAATMAALSGRPAGKLSPLSPLSMSLTEQSGRRRISDPRGLGGAFGVSLSHSRSLGRSPGSSPTRLGREDGPEENPDIYVGRSAASIEEQQQQHKEQRPPRSRGGSRPSSRAPSKGPALTAGDKCDQGHIVPPLSLEVAQSVSPFIIKPVLPSAVVEGTQARQKAGTADISSLARRISR